MATPYADQVAAAAIGLVDRVTPITSGPISAAGAIGYATAVGTGGTVTQITSKATGVSLNALCGTIVLNGASLGATTSVTFTMTTNQVAANDIVIAQHESVGTLGAYTVYTAPAAGSVAITVRNLTAGALLEAIVLRFIVIKGSVN